MINKNPADFVNVAFREHADLRRTGEHQLAFMRDRAKFERETVKEGKRPMPISLEKIFEEQEAKDVTPLPPYIPNTPRTEPFKERKLEWSVLTSINAFQAGCTKIYRLIYKIVVFLKSRLCPTKIPLAKPHVPLNPKLLQDAVTILRVLIPKSDHNRDPNSEKFYYTRDELSNLTGEKLSLDLSQRNNLAKQRFSEQLKKAYNEECENRKARIDTWKKNGGMHQKIIELEEEALKTALEAYETLAPLLLSSTRSC